MSWAHVHEFASALWVVWFFVLFIGILVWVLRPSRRRGLEAHADIPLRDDPLATRPPER